MRSSGRRLEEKRAGQAQQRIFGMMPRKLTGGG
jgi:hypothetical protein